MEVVRANLLDPGPGTPPTGAQGGDRPDAVAVLRHGRRGLVSRCTQSGDNVELNFVDSSSAWTPATSSWTLAPLRAKPEASHPAGQATSPSPCSTCGPAWLAPRAAGGEPGGGLLGKATSGWEAPSTPSTSAALVRCSPGGRSRSAGLPRRLPRRPDGASSPGPRPTLHLVPRFTGAPDAA